MSDQATNDDAASEVDRRDRRFRIAGDAAEALKVVLAQLPDDD